MPVIVAILLYAGALVCANLSIAAFGPWVSPINSFLLIGLDLTLRDRLHDSWSGQPAFWARMAGLIIFAAGISYLINPAAGRIALASFVAFVAAGMVDALVYHALRRNPRTTGYMARVNGSNAASAAVDSLLFPTLAFGAFMPAIVLLQFLAKLAGGFLWSLILRPMLIIGVRR